MTYGLVVSSTLASSPAQIDRLTQQWLDTERQASHLQSDWKEQEPLLVQRLTLLKAEKLQLQTLLQKNNTNDSDVDARRAELLAEQTALEKQQTQVATMLSLLLSRTVSMASQLPPALLSAWKKEQDTLEENAETSPKLQVALAQLNHIADFDRRITVHEGPITTADGNTILVKQLYLGLSMAWFSSRDGKHVGWGQANSEGWNWHFDSSINVDEIRKSINIFEKLQTAEMVNLPIYLSAQSALQSSIGEPQ